MLFYSTRKRPAHHRKNNDNETHYRLKSAHFGIGKSEVRIQEFPKTKKNKFLADIWKNAVSAELLDFRENYGRTRKGRWSGSIVMEMNDSGVPTIIDSSELDEGDGPLNEILRRVVVSRLESKRWVSDMKDEDRENGYYVFIIMACQT